MTVKGPTIVKVLLYWICLVVMNEGCHFCRGEEIAKIVMKMNLASLNSE